MKTQGLSGAAGTELLHHDGEIDKGRAAEVLHFRVAENLRVCSSTDETDLGCDGKLASVGEGLAAVVGIHEA